MLKYSSLGGTYCLWPEAGHTCAIFLCSCPRGTHLCGSQSSTGPVQTSPIARRDQKRQKSYSSSVSQKGGARESKEVICWQQPGGLAVFLLRIKVSLPAFQAVFPLLLPSAA